MNNIRKWSLYVAIPILAAAIGYTYLWYGTAERLEENILVQVEKLKDKGYRIVHGAIHTTGFPNKITLHIEDPLLEMPPAVGTSISVKGTLTATAGFMKPGHVEFETDGEVEIKSTLLGDVHNTILKAKSAECCMPIDAPLKDLEIELDDVHIGFVDIKAKEVSFKIKVDKTNTCTVSFEDLDLGFKPLNGFPKTIEKLEAKVTLKEMLDLESPLQDAIRNWAQKGGVLDIDKLEVKWGDTKVDGSGTFTVDENLQPLCSYAAEIYGLDELLNKLGSNGYIHKDLVPVVRTSLAFLKERKKDGDDDDDVYHKVAITVQNQDLSIGSIPIVRLPQIDWSKVSN